MNMNMTGQIQADSAQTAAGGTVSKNFSVRITALRFILAVLVVFIHSDCTELNFSDGTVTATVPLFASIIQEIIAGTLGGVAVPLFFVISSYLFFVKPKSLKDTVKSKLRTIVLPYALWTFLTIALYFTAQCIPFTREFFTQKWTVITNWTVIDFFKSFVGLAPDGEFRNPLVYQFWYIRDLLLFMIFSPLIKIIALRFPLFYITGVLAAGLLHGAGLFNDPFKITYALPYFSLGFYAVKYIDSVLNAVDKIKWKDFICAYVLYNAFTMYASYMEIKTGLFSGTVTTVFTILLFLKLAGVLSKNEKIYSPLKKLSSYSFWIYAGHAPFLVTGIKKLLVRLLHLSGAFTLLGFFVTAFLTIAVLMITGVFIKRFIPKLFALFTGGRV